MKEHNLLFSDEMARAILQGRKTQTRRLKFAGIPRVGDVLVGRECWAALAPDPEGDDCDPVYEYRADHDPPLRKPGGWDDAEPGDPDMVHWRPSIHMPRGAARIVRPIVGVRAQRLQDISEADAEAEGFASIEGWGVIHMTAVESFAHTWDAIYGKRGCGWGANPFVVVIEFGRENVGGAT